MATDAISASYARARFPTGAPQLARHAPERAGGGRVEGQGFKVGFRLLQVRLSGRAFDVVARHQRPD